MSDVHSTKCSGCDSPATIHTDKTNYCVVHYRYRQMRHGAQRGAKVVPSVSELDRLVSALIDMKCPACSRVMNWLLKDGKSTVLTLQHDRDGTIRLICKGCNSRHHLHPGDTFYQLPEGYKRCPTCEAVKPNGEFTKLKSGKLFSKCRPCASAVSLAYYRANTERCKAKHREYMQSRKDG